MIPGAHWGTKSSTHTHDMEPCMTESLQHYEVDYISIARGWLRSIRDL